MEKSSQILDEIEKKLEQAQEMIEQAQEMIKNLKKKNKKLNKYCKNSFCHSYLSQELSYFNLQKYMRKHYV